MYIMGFLIIIVQYSSIVLEWISPVNYTHHNYNVAYFGPEK